MNRNTSLKDLADSIASAIYAECLDMPELLEIDSDGVRRETESALSSGQADSILSFLAERMEGFTADERPQTDKAIKAIIAYL